MISVVLDEFCINQVSLCFYLQYPSTDRSFQEIQIEINNAAVNLNQAASNIVTASRGTPKQLADSSREYSTSYSEFIRSGLTMAGQ